MFIKAFKNTTFKPENKFKTECTLSHFNAKTLIQLIQTEHNTDTEREINISKIFRIY